MKDKRDELTILCDKIRKCNKKMCNRNEIVCAKAHLKQYVGNDRNKLLKIKAQIKEHSDSNGANFFTYISTIISTLSLCLVILSNTLPDEQKIIYALYALGGLLTIVVFTLLCFVRFVKRNKRQTWERYIEAVVDEVEKEL